MVTKLPVIVIVGPTASGKTQLAIDVALRLNCCAEVISVDSALIYQGMDIGTAKPTMDERKGIPHHLIDIIEPTESYSVGQFLMDADRLVEQIHQRGKVPILVGGTMMYHTAFLHGLASLPPADQLIRQDIESEASRLGWGALYQQLITIDPIAALTIHPNDPQRLIRALEVYRITGKPLSVLQQQTTRQHHYPIITVKLLYNNRQLLHDRIASRLDNMFSQGFVTEVKSLLARPGMHHNCSALRCVGYRQMVEYLENRVDITTAKNKALFATRQYAKRQMTWLRRNFAETEILYSDVSTNLFHQFMQAVPNQWHDLFDQ